MDTESLRELQNSISQLTSVLASQTTALTGMATALNASAGTLQQNSEAHKKNSEANKNTSGIDRLAESNKKASEVLAEKSGEIAKGFSATGTALNSFTQAVLSNQAGFEKYGSTVSGLGQAAWDIGKNFGILGKFLGGLGFAIGKVTEAGFKQADGLLKGVDALSDIGAAGQITSDQMYKMGHKMGLNSQNLEIFTKAATGARGSMIALGNTSGEGIKEFANLTAVTQRQRNAFQRLGVSQEELMERQASYIELQNKSGLAISKRDIADGTVQRLSLEYAKSLTIVSAATGRNAKEAQEGQERALAANNIMIHRRQLQMQIDEAKNSGNAELLDKLERKKLVEEQLLNAAEQTGDAQTLAAMQSKIATGAYTTSSASLLRMGVDVDRIQREGEQLSLEELRKQGIMGTANAAFNTQLQAGLQSNIKNLGTALVYSEDTAKQYGVTTSLMSWSAKNANTQFDKRNKEAIAAAGKPEDGTTTKKVDQDPAQVARNNLTNMEILAKQKMDDLVKSMNPLLGNMGALKVLAVAAAGVATIMTVALAAKGLGAIRGGLGGLLGRGAGGAAAASGAAAIAGGGGGAAAIAGGAAKAAGGADAGIQNLNKAASGGGGMVGGFLKGIVDGLAAAGRPPVPLYIVAGSVAIGAAITALGAGLAGATWVMGKAMPSLANGLKAFDKLNGPNLQQVGFGMAGLGAGILAMGAGNVAGAIGNVVNFLVGGEDPIKKVSSQVLELQSFNFDKTKVKNNSEAMVAFARAMAAASAIGAAGAVAQAGGAIAGGVARFFGGKPPLQQFVDFSRLKIDAKQTRINAQAFVEFSTAMSSYKGYGSGIGALSATLGDAAAKFFGVRPPVDQFAYFSKLPIDEKKAAANSKSFVAFANAMAEYRGGPGLMETISALAGAGLGKIFGEDGPVKSFEKFAKMDFGPKAKSNADAFFKYAQSANMLSTAATAPGGGGTPASGGRSGAPSEGSSPGGGGGSFSSAVQSGVQAGGYAGGAVVGAVGGAVSAVGGAIGSAVTAGYDAVRIRSLLNFTGASGSYENFQALNPGMKIAVLNAAADYKQQTGNKLQVNSARRNLADQQRIWDTSVRNGTPGRQPNGRLVARPNANAPHMRGNAIDLQQGINDTSRTNRILARHKLVNKYGAADLPHYDLQAEYGGIFDGPSVGFPSDSDRGKKLGSLNMDSLLMKLAKTSSDTLSTVTTSSTSSATDNFAAEDQGAMNLELYNMIQYKLDNVLNALDSSYSTQSKILKHSMV